MISSISDRRTTTHVGAPPSRVGVSAYEGYFILYLKINQQHLELALHTLTSLKNIFSSFITYATGKKNNAFC